MTRKIQMQVDAEFMLHDPVAKLTRKRASQLMFGGMFFSALMTGLFFGVWAGLLTVLWTFSGAFLYGVWSGLTGPTYDVIEVEVPDE